MKVYEGEWKAGAEQPRVLVNGKPLSPTPSLKIWKHSPDGFAWGYGGSGPAQLALAILLDYFEGDVGRAREHYQDFKWARVSHWPINGSWKISGAEIAAFLCEQDRTQCQ